MPPVPSSCVRTFSGKRFNLIDPKCTDVCVEDVAYHLARQRRYLGMGMSVAEHSCLVHDLILRDIGSRPLAYAGLMHDATETYIGDLTRPVKAMDRFFQGLEKSIQPVVMGALGVHWDESVEHVVKIYDCIAARAEAFRLMPCRGEDIEWLDTPLDMGCVSMIVPYQPRAAEALFLKKYREHV